MLKLLQEFPSNLALSFLCSARKKCLPGFTFQVSLEYTFPGNHNKLFFGKTSKKGKERKTRSGHLEPMRVIVTGRREVFTILVWYGQPPEVQFTQGGGGLSRKFWKFIAQISVFHRFMGCRTGAKSGTINTVATVPCPTALSHKFSSPKLLRRMVK